MIEIIFKIVTGLTLGLCLGVRSNVKILFGIIERQQEVIRKHNNLLNYIVRESENVNAVISLVSDNTHELIRRQKAQQPYLDEIQELKSRICALEDLLEDNGP